MTGGTIYSILDQLLLTVQYPLFIQEKKRGKTVGFRNIMQLHNKRRHLKWTENLERLN